MSQSEKAGYYRALKDAGVEFDRHYREYSTDELKAAYDRLVEAQPQLAVDAGLINPPPAAQDAAPPVADPLPPDTEGAAEAWAAMMSGQTREESMAAHPTAQPTPPPAPAPRPRDPNEVPGQRLNTQAQDEPIRVDENGLIWYQEEVLKPGYAKPRARRVLQYLDTGTKTQTIKSGDFMESFEVAGDGEPRTAEVKITMPSYQVGIYKDPRLPFRIHVYNENRGFDFFEVQDYYGGPEMVPPSIKRIYVENVLCYDIRLTIQAIQDEYRQLQLARKV